MTLEIEHWILIGLVAATTYLTRILGIEFMADRKLNATLRKYFNYVPVGIIAALIVKEALVPVDIIEEATGRLGVSLPVLIGCLATAITIKKTESFLPSVVFGAVIGLITRYYL